MLPSVTTTGNYLSFNDLTSECRHSKLQTRPLVREDAVGKEKVIVSPKKKRNINLVFSVF
jgi:hypothetical protein